MLVIVIRIGCPNEQKSVRNPGGFLYPCDIGSGMNMIDRRGFFKRVCATATAVSGLSMGLAGCDVEPVGDHETVLDRLLRHEDRVSYEVRQVGGTRHVYVTEIRGVREDREQELYWIYSVDGVAGTRSADSSFVAPHQEVRWQRVRPREV